MALARATKALLALWVMVVVLPVEAESEAGIKVVVNSLALQCCLCQRHHALCRWWR